MSINKPYSILIVDDDVLYLKTINHIIKNISSNIETKQAKSGYEAINILEKETPDLIIIDWEMPGMSGIEFIERLQKKPDFHDIPAIVCTGRMTDSENLKTAFDAGAVDFISKPFNIFELQARIANLLKLRVYINELENAEQVIFSLARAVEAKDKYTEGHCGRLAYFAEALGQELDLPENDLLVLRRGGFLHDIGKIAISDTILLKAGPLSDKEFKAIKKHPEEGEKICLPLKTLKPVLSIIRYHHEKINGSGYPEGLKGNEIPELARIVGIVDCYDSLITNRPYRKAMSKSKAIQIMSDETDRGLWDPKIITVFFKLIKENSAKFGA